MQRKVSESLICTDYWISLKDRDGYKALELYDDSYFTFQSVIQTMFSERASLKDAY